MVLQVLYRLPVPEVLSRLCRPCLQVLRHSRAVLQGLEGLAVFQVDLLDLEVPVVPSDLEVQVYLVDRRVLGCPVLLTDLQGLQVRQDQGYP